MKIRTVIRSLRRLVFLCGLLFIALTGAALSGLPWDWYRWLAHPEDGGREPPDFIVVMGGGGIPSESGLTRVWKAAELAVLFPGAGVVVAMPVEPSESASRGIVHELVIRGVDRARIRREPDGRNTREQARNVMTLLGSGAEDSRVALVTSPEHMRRTLGSFRKAGFTRLSVFPSWSEELKADLAYDEADMGGPSLYGAVGGSMMIRYRFWDNLVVLAKCARETAAIGYYRVMGWM